MNHELTALRPLIKKQLIARALVVLHLSRQSSFFPTRIRYTYTLTHHQQHHLPARHVVRARCRRHRAPRLLIRISGYREREEKVGSCGGTRPNGRQALAGLHQVRWGRACIVVPAQVYRRQARLTGRQGARERGERTMRRTEISFSPLFSFLFFFTF